MMIGDTVVHGHTFESIKRELHHLMEEGFVEIDNRYRPFLTDKGIERLAGL